MPRNYIPAVEEGVAEALKALEAAGKDGSANFRRAVALNPGYWGNQFRLAHAAWGGERLRALARVESKTGVPFGPRTVAADRETVAIKAASPD